MSGKKRKTDRKIGGSNQSKKSRVGIDRIQFQAVLLLQAICFVTPAQKDALLEELAAMEELRCFEVSRWYISNCLQRARSSNSRML
jgi:hypothetical protein